MWRFLLISLILVVGYAWAADPTQTNLVLFNGPTYDDHSIYAYDDWTGVTKNRKFNSSAKIALYLHGYLENTTSSTVRKIVTAYNTRKDYNLVVYNWSAPAAEEYILGAAPNSADLGDKMGQVIWDFIQSGFNPENLHVIGHSLGGQMAGYIGRKVNSESNGAVTLPRITGLDPAGPEFFPALLFTYLSASDAKMVDIIHGDQGLYGQPEATGTVDFYPNEGTRFQPQCKVGIFVLLSADDLCSHQSAVTYWAESVQYSSPQFLAGKSSGSSSSLTGTVTGLLGLSGNNNAKADAVVEVVPMGIDCPTTASGIYYLTTGETSPYALGNSGVATS